MTYGVDAALKGAAAGAVATIPMSAVMLAADRAGLMGKHPPEIIAEKTLDAAGVPPTETAKTTTAVTGHFAFGAAAGALFGLLQHRSGSPGLPIARGIGYGLALYTVSYAGWIPAMNIMPSPTHDRPGRQSSMIAAHVVFGAALAVLVGLRVPGPSRAD